SYPRLAFSPDGSRVAATEIGRAVVLDRATGRKVLDVRDLGGQGGPPGWSADGSRLAFTLPVAVGDGFKWDVRVCDVPTGATTLQFRPPEIANTLALSADGSRVFLSQISPFTEKRRNEIQVWDGRTGTLLRAIDAGKRYVTSLAALP